MVHRRSSSQEDPVRAHALFRHDFKTNYKTTFNETFTPKNRLVANCHLPSLASVDEKGIAHVVPRIARPNHHRPEIAPHHRTTDPPFAYSGHAPNTSSLTTDLSKQGGLVQASIIPSSGPRIVTSSTVLPLTKNNDQPKPVISAPPKFGMRRYVPDLTHHHRQLQNNRKQEVVEKWDIVTNRPLPVIQKTRKVPLDEYLRDGAEWAGRKRNVVVEDGKFRRKMGIFLGVGEQYRRGGQRTWMDQM